MEPVCHANWCVAICTKYHGLSYIIRQWCCWCGATAAAKFNGYSTCVWKKFLFRHFRIISTSLFEQSSLTNLKINYDTFSAMEQCNIPICRKQTLHNNRCVKKSFLPSFFVIQNCNAVETELIFAHLYVSSECKSRRIKTLLRMHDSWRKKVVVMHAQAERERVIFMMTKTH